MNGEEYVVCKKKNLIDEAPISKKAARNQQKNLNKTLATVKMMQELDMKKQMQKKQSQKTNSSATNSKSDNKIDSKTKKKVDDIKAILPQLSQKLILQTLEKHNFDQQQTLQQLFNIQPESIDPPQPPSTSQKRANKSKPQSKQELANELLNEIYQNNQQIDPSQFQQLFAEIADIIKQEQKTKGMDLFEINSFIDDCYLIKNVILEDQNEIYIDENDELCKQTEIFMEEIIKNRVALEIKRQEQFPTLGAVTKSNPSQKGTIQKIQQQYEKQRRNQDYFTPSTVPRIYHHNFKQQSNKNSVFMVNNNPRSYEDILQLSKEYNDMGIDKLKWIYLRLEDINLCKRFLDRFYPDRKRVIKVEKVQKKQNNTGYSASNKPVLKHSYKRLEDANFKSYTLAQIRDELDHLFKLRSLFRMTKGKTTNIGHRKQLERLAHRDDPRIDKLIQVARFKAIENMIESDLQYIDLHGYREEQIDQLFQDIADMIRTQFKKGNSKLQTCKVGSNVCCAVRALTGKGLHSKYNRSVLKPALMSWCESKGYKTTQTEDSINIFIEVR